jgi:hypothetical protein
MFELWSLIGETLAGMICKRKGHIRNYYWLYGDEICPRCSLWLNEPTGK